MKKKPPSKIWEAFDLANSGRLRNMLRDNHIEEDTIQAIIDIIGREEYRLERLLESRRK